MIQQRQKILAVSLFWIDLGLTIASFYFAYHLRTLVNIEGYVVMPIGTYTWLLLLILPIWAILLPVFRVYSPRFLRLRDQLAQLSKAIGLSWILMAAVLFFLNQEATSRLIALFTLALNYVLLVSYRLVLFTVRSHSRYGCSTRRDHREWTICPGIRPLDRSPRGMGTPARRGFPGRRGQRYSGWGRNRRDDLCRRSSTPRFLRRTLPSV